MSTTSESNDRPLVTSEAPKAVELTAYFRGAAVIRENRSIELPKGDASIFMAGLPTHFLPGSLTIVSASGPGKLTMGTSSYSQANLNTATMLAKAVGSQVVLIEELRGGGTERHEGELVHVIDGHQAIIKPADHDDGRIRIVPVPNKFELIEGLPEGLSDLASLSLDVATGKGGQFEVDTLYESGGVNWAPTYEIFYDAKAGVLKRFACYVLLRNVSGTDYVDAEFQLISGENKPTVQQPHQHHSRGGMRAMSASLEMAGGADEMDEAFAVATAEVEDVGDQKMYLLKGRVTLAHGDTKNPALLFAENVPVDQEYHLVAGHYERLRGVSEDDLAKLPISVRLKAKNNKTNKLGVPLPPGAARVLEPDSRGKMQKTDSTKVRGHVAANETFFLEMGNPSRNLKATRELTYDHTDPEVEEKDDTFVDEGGLPEDGDRVHALTAEVGMAGGPDVGTPEGHSRRLRQIAESAAGDGDDDDKKKKPEPRFREQERVVTIFNFGDEVESVYVHEDVPSNAQFLDNTHDFANFNDSTGNGHYEVEVPAASKGTPGETKIRYRIKWQIN